jgi:hypothetical protein
MLSGAARLAPLPGLEQFSVGSKKRALRVDATA